MRSTYILNKVLNIFMESPSFPKISEQLFEGEALEVFESQKDPHDPNKLKPMPPFAFLCIDFDYHSIYEQLNQDDKIDYVSEHSKILYPEATVQESINYMKSITFDNGVNLYEDSYKKTEVAVGDSSKYDMDALIVLFAFLHEIGHYEHFLSIGKKPYQLLGGDRVYAEQYADAFAQKRLQRMTVKDRNKTAQQSGFCEHSTPQTTKSGDVE